MAALLHRHQHATQSDRKVTAASVSSSEMTLSRRCETGAITQSMLIKPWYDRDSAIRSSPAHTVFLKLKSQRCPARTPRREREPKTSPPLWLAPLTFASLPWRPAARQRAGTMLMSGAYFQTEARPFKFRACAAAAAASHLLSVATVQVRCSAFVSIRVARLETSPWTSSSSPTQVQAGPSAVSARQAVADSVLRSSPQ